MISFLIITLPKFAFENKFRKFWSTVGLDYHFLIWYLALNLQIWIIY